MASPECRISCENGARRQRAAETGGADATIGLPMSELPVPSAAPAATPVTLERRSPELVALGADAPTLGQLFTFMRDAELRFDSLRMRIVDRRVTTTGLVDEVSEVWLRQPSQARVVTRRLEPGQDTLTGDHSVWLTDGEVVRTYDAVSRTASTRPVRTRPEGLTDPDLPPFSRAYAPHILLPFETVVDTFVHPHGFCQNVLVTARLRLLGTTPLAGDREAYLLRADHPRTTEVLTDRPDRWLEVGVDRLTGAILLLTEHIADLVTRDAEVTDFEPDAALADDVFKLHISSDVRRMY